jgi:hypothetical protein
MSIKLYDTQPILYDIQPKISVGKCPGIGVVELLRFSINLSSS